LSKSERNKVEDWAAMIFHDLLYNLVNPWEKKEIYQSVGLDHKFVTEAFMKEMDREEIIKEEMMETNNIFRVLCKTLLKANIITDRTRKTYAQYVNMEELHAESDEVAGQEIADEGLKKLEKINQSRMVA
jgi:hypothetical protein